MKILKSRLLLPLMLSLVVLCIFYGKLLVHCNSIYFGSGMDTWQSYYSALYHLTYDKSYFHTGGMNYPYGENIFFTGGYIPIIFFLKMINHIIPVAGYTIGIINLFMLFSIAACALSLYLILRELLLPQLYSSIVAVCIAFFSPQIQRLGGTLSYEFLIPLFIYMLMKFYRNPSVKQSILIGLLVFFGITSHLYFFTFFCFLSFFYWTILFFSGEEKFSRSGFVLKHFFVQMILPFLVLNIILHLTNQATDRTQYPWGFFDYKSTWAGVFFPFGKPYQNIARIICQPGEPNWEGIAYIGIVSVFVCVLLIAAAVRKIFTLKIKQLVAVTDNKLLNIFLWASIAALLYSFCYPFIWAKDFFIHYIGPLKEIRALGRCAWLFFYVINIVSFYVIYHWLKDRKKLQYSLLLLSLAGLGYDTYLYTGHYENNLNASVSELTDKQNNLPENSWLKNINLQRYQAIIPLPYFHVGSENVWISSEKSDILKYVLFVSLKSGLPTTAVTLSRTSLSETYKNICMILEPYRKLDIVKDFPDTKPFLVMAQPDKLNESEKHLLSQCKFLVQAPEYSVYELNYATLQHYTDSLYTQTENEFHKAKTYLIDGYYSTDSVKNYVHCDFEDKPSAIAYQGKGAYLGNIDKYNVIYEGSVPNYKDSNYIFSFWMYNFTTDLYPRTTIEISLKDSAGNLYRSDYTAPLHILKTLDGKWALLEDAIKIRHATDKIKITLWNTDLGKKDTLILDEFWLQPASTTIYKEGTDYTFKNNRYYRP